MKVDVSECSNELQTFISSDLNVAMRSRTAESCLCLDSLNSQLNSEES